MIINGITVNKNNLAYKGVSSDLEALCGGKYVYDKPLGEWYEVAPNEATNDTVFCHRYGFHCARNPLDSYYGHHSTNRVFLVEVGGDIDEEDNMLCATKIRFIKELDLQTYVAHALRYEALHPKMCNDEVVISEKYRCKDNSSYVIVKGKNPKVMAPKGTIVGVLKESKDGSVEAMDMWIVEGEYKANKYYGLCLERS